ACLGAHARSLLPHPQLRTTAGAVLRSHLRDSPAALPLSTGISYAPDRVTFPLAGGLPTHYTRPLPISISTLMRSFPFASNRERRDWTCSRTARRSAAASCR